MSFPHSRHSNHWSPGNSFTALNITKTLQYLNISQPNHPIINITKTMFLLKRIFFSGILCLLDYEGNLDTWNKLVGHWNGVPRSCWLNVRVHWSIVVWVHWVHWVHPCTVFISIYILLILFEHAVIHFFVSSRLGHFYVVNIHFQMFCVSIWLRTAL